MKDFDLNEVYIYVHVVQAGSFTKAANALNMPISTVSARISSLENRLNLTLLHRTTRQLKITEAGQQYYEQCLKGIEQIEIAEEHLNNSKEEPSGLVRLTAPVSLGGILLPPITSALSKLYPKLKFELLLRDESSDLIADGIDLAIRAGELKDSTLITKKVCEAEFSAYASPKYIKKYGKLSHPKDLKSHRCILFSPLELETWKFTKDGKSINIKINDFITTNDLNTVKNLALLGQGIALIPNFVEECQKEKLLVQLFPQWKSISKSIQLLYPPQRFPSAKMKAILEIAEKVIKEKGKH